MKEKDAQLWETNITCLASCAKSVVRHFHFSQILHRKEKVSGKPFLTVPKWKKHVWYQIRTFFMILMMLTNDCSTLINKISCSGYEIGAGKLREIVTMLHSSCTKSDTCGTPFSFSQNGGAQWLVKKGHGQRSKTMHLHFSWNTLTLRPSGTNVKEEGLRAKMWVTWILPASWHLNYK